MHTYLQITGILFHVIVGGILAMSVFFYWCVRDQRKTKKTPTTGTPIEVDKIGVDGEVTKVPAILS